MRILNYSILLENGGEKGNIFEVKSVFLHKICFTFLKYIYSQFFVGSSCSSHDLKRVLFLRCTVGKRTFGQDKIYATVLFRMVNRLLAGHRPHSGLVLVYYDEFRVQQNTKCLKGGHSRPLH